MQVTLLIDLYRHQASGRTQIGLVKANISVLCFCIATAEVFSLWKKAASGPVQLGVTINTGPGTRGPGTQGPEDPRTGDPRTGDPRTRDPTI